MAPVRDDDWSDSDEENLAEVETSVLLGVPDGPVDIDSDLNDVAVSRIGGHPAFLTATEPPFSSSECKVCGNPMELLVQMWCPFEDSPMDRALYIWGCPRVGCQGQEGTVRAWRALRFNEKYAAKLQKKLERQTAKAQTKVESQVAKANPFASKGNAISAPNPFGLGAQIFGQASPPPFQSDVTDGNADEGDSGSESDEDDDSASEKSLLTAISTVSIADSAWKSSPAYPPLYLSTISEYLPAQAKPKVPSTAEVVDPAGKDGSWLSEAYENSMNTDQAFDRFSQRVEAEPEQCVRYELHGTPLPFSSSDAVFKKLFAAPDGLPPAVTKAAFTVVHPQKRTFDPAAVPPCPVCRSKRVFECQLMPNLINVLRPKESEPRKQTDEERRKAVEEALKRGNKDQRGSMEWGTCMVFSCEKDCCFDDETKEESKFTWREEVVLIQWDS
ncbi:hypothetical protein CC2G_011703 [Coprinopsis cinerea AmutBmut pab1-1]|nr:hypothetical protein CC2G_011703 [Coprinopsis cinerea AmutBmut pab1-1]